MDVPEEAALPDEDLDLDFDIDLGHELEMEMDQMSIALGRRRSSAFSIGINTEDDISFSPISPIPQPATKGFQFKRFANHKTL